jgi:hypothetical protein
MGELPTPQTYSCDFELGGPAGHSRDGQMVDHSVHVNAQYQPPRRVIADYGNPSPAPAPLAPTSPGR